MALSLYLTEDYFDKDITHPGCSAVIAHYPPQARSSDHFGIDPHTDSECVF
jgi:isopenicillin N synthase-like dioxygenase